MVSLCIYSSSAGSGFRVINTPRAKQKCRGGGETNLCIYLHIYPTAITYCTVLYNGESHFQFTKKVAGIINHGGVHIYNKYCGICIPAVYPAAHVAACQGSSRKAAGMDAVPISSGAHNQFTGLYTMYTINIKYV